MNRKVTFKELNEYRQYRVTLNLLSQRVGARIEPQMRAIEEKAAAILDDVEEFINTVDDTLIQNILICRFVKLMGWEKTAMKLNYSASHLKKVFGRWKNSNL